MYEAYQKIDEVIRGLKSLRETIDTVFSLWYDEILQLAESIGVSESTPRKTSLQRNRSNIPSQSAKEHYKRVVAIPVLDSFISQLEERFDSEGKQGHTILCLVPSMMLNFSPSVQLSEHINDLLYWEQDLPCSTSLPSELRRWQSLWKRKRDEDETNIPDNLLLTLRSCDCSSFPNIHSLLVIACTLPITSAEAERSFSLLRRIKIYTRSTLAEQHFSDLAAIAMNYGERVPVDDVLSFFCAGSSKKNISRITLYRLTET